MTTPRIHATKAAVLTILLLTRAHTALTRRIAQMDSDRGDIPGWAIASAAACVFGAIVYAAVSGVVTKYVAKIR